MQIIVPQPKSTKLSIPPQSITTLKFVLLISQLSDALIQVPVRVMIVYGIVAIEQIIEFCPVAALKP